MPSPKVRADHESLREIARSFSQQADATQRMLDNIRSKLSVLKNGDWVGKGATKFYGEMEADIVPAVQRLASALERSAAVTSQISRIMHQAEDDAARLFRSGSDGASLVGGQVLRAAGAGSGIRSAVKADVGSRGSIGSIPGYSAYNTKADSAGGGVVGRKLKDFPPNVRELVAKSPTLLKKLDIAERLGYRIVLGPKGSVTGTDREAGLITIESGHSDLQQVDFLAHETAHAAKGPHVFLDPTDLPVTKEEWVKRQTEVDLHGEGDAVMNEAIVREEILNAGGPDVGITDTVGGKFSKIYNEYKKGDETWDSAVHRIGELYANEHPNNMPGTIYRDYYAKMYTDYWDEKVAPARAKNKK